MSTKSSKPKMEEERVENAELLALQRIDETCIQLQQQGKYLAALECMERGLVLRQHFFGADSDEVWKACKTVGEMCNLLAMTYLQQEDFVMVLELLKKAEILTERDEAGRAVTYNNLACYYRRQGKLHAALNYLQKALKIEGKLENVENPADTHLNMCAVLSQLGRHAKALEHSQSALILLQEEIFSSSMTGGATSQNKADRIAVLAIAYHNIGVEQEFLKQYDRSLSSYRKGVEIGETHLGAEHGITIALRNSFLAARRAMVMSGKTTGPLPGRGDKKKGAKSPTAAAGRGSKASPTAGNVEQWDGITGAYGDMSGVPPVRVPQQVKPVINKPARTIATPASAESKAGEGSIGLGETSPTSPDDSEAAPVTIDNGAASEPVVAPSATSTILNLKQEPSINEHFALITPRDESRLADAPAVEGESKESAGDDLPEDTPPAESVDPITFLKTRDRAPSSESKEEAKVDTTPGESKKEDRSTSSASEESKVAVEETKSSGDAVFETQSTDHESRAPPARQPPARAPPARAPPSTAAPPSDIEEKKESPEETKVADEPAAAATSNTTEAVGGEAKEE